MKKLLFVAGFLVFIGTGYLSLNIATATQARSVACTVSDCTNPFTGMSFALIGVETAVVTPGIAIAVGIILEEFAVTMLGLDLAVAEETYKVARNQNDMWDTFWYYNLRPALRAQTIQLNVAEADQSRIIGAYADAMDANRTSMAIQREEIETHREVEVSSNGCVAGTIVGGMARSYALRTAYAAAAPVEKLPRSANRVGSTGARGTGADMQARWQKFVTHYCNPDANGGAGGCSEAGEDVGRDLDISGELFMKETIDLRDERTKRVIDDMIENIAEPFVMNPVPLKAAELDTGRQRLLYGETYKSRRQAVYDALYFPVARRLPGSDMAEFLGPLRSAAGVSAVEISDNPSHNEIMEVMMNERFRTGSYGVEQVDTPVSGSRELVIQQAFTAIQMNDFLDLLDRYSVFLSAQAAGEINRAFPDTADGQAVLK